MKTRSKNNMDTTFNRSVYNKTRKEYLEKKGKIRCSWCKYHKGENSRDKAYGGWEDKRFCYPNWKLVSKNRKQWMEKKLEFEESYRIYRNKIYYKIEF